MEDRRNEETAACQETAAQQRDTAPSRPVPARARRSDRGHPDLRGDLRELPLPGLHGSVYRHTVGLNGSAESPKSPKSRLTLQKFGNPTLKVPGRFSSLYPSRCRESPRQKGDASWRERRR